MCFQYHYNGTRDTAFLTPNVHHHRYPRDDIVASAPHSSSISTITDGASVSTFSFHNATSYENVLWLPKEQKPCRRKTS